MAIHIRLATIEDAADILSIYAPYIESTVVSFETEVPSVEAFWGRIHKVLQTSPWLVATIEGEIVGYAYATAHRSRAAYQWNREVSAYIKAEFQRKGIGRLLYQKLFALLKHQGYTNLLAGVVMPNPASVGLHKSLGFQSVGIYDQVGYKFGAYYSVQWLEKFIGDATPTAILSMSEAIQTDQWQQILEPNSNV